MTFLAVVVYAGGFGYIWDRKGFLRAAVWPLALGIALAKVAEREMEKEDA